MIDRTALRQQFYDAWQNYRQKKPLSGLQENIVNVILIHPEYHQAIEAVAKNPEQDYFPELGESNPFLHLSLHLSIREQIGTDRPKGIKAIFQQLAKKHESHDVEHKMLEVLAKNLWQAQKDNKPPSEESYLKQLQQLL